MVFFFNITRFQLRNDSIPHLFLPTSIESQVLNAIYCSLHKDQIAQSLAILLHPRPALIAFPTPSLNFLKPLGTAEMSSSAAAPSATETPSQPDAMAQFRAQLENADFSDDTSSLLAKYSDKPASLELHIYPTHYRFGGQEGIIPRDNPVMDMFLQSVRDGEIPAIAGEVFLDSDIPLYEGCAILQLVDYRNFSPELGGNAEKDKTRRPSNGHTLNQANNASQSVQSPQQQQQQQQLQQQQQPQQPLQRGTQEDENAHKSELSAQNAQSYSEQSQQPQQQSNSSDQDQQDQQQSTENQQGTQPLESQNENPPKTRVLLRPTDSSILNDLIGLNHYRSRRLPDKFKINMETEILNLAMRNIDLSVPLRKPFNLGLKAETTLGASARPTQFKHRSTKPRPLRRITEDSPHKGTAYEEFMLSMAELDKSSRTSKFGRMSLVEQVRRKKQLPGAQRKKPATQLPPPQRNFEIRSDMKTPQYLAKQLASGQLQSAQARMAGKLPPQLQAQLQAQNASNAIKGNGAGVPGMARGPGQIGIGMPGGMPGGASPGMPSGVPQGLAQAGASVPSGVSPQMGNMPMKNGIPSAAQAAALNLNHIPPGPTAHHQIQAQAQKQSILRARAQQEQMMQQRMPQMQQQRPMSAMGGGPINRPMSQMGMQGGLNNPQVSNSPLNNSQMSNSPMNGSQMGSPLNSQMGSPQMGSPQLANSQMGSPKLSVAQMQQMMINNRMQQMQQMNQMNRMNNGQMNNGQMNNGQMNNGQMNNQMNMMMSDNQMQMPMNMNRNMMGNRMNQNQ